MHRSMDSVYHQLNPMQSNKMVFVSSYNRAVLGTPFSGNKEGASSRDDEVVANPQGY